jgi:hypothetical protein
VINASAFALTWQSPTEPNGIVLRFAVVMLSAAQQPVVYDAGLVLSYEVFSANIRPSTNYSFIIQACTFVGCTDSAPASITSLESGEGNAFIIITHYLYLRNYQSAKSAVTLVLIHFNRIEQLHV